MGKVISKLNLFKSCRDNDAKPSGKKGEDRKDACKLPAPRIPGPLPEPPVDALSSDMELDEEPRDFTQIGFRNCDSYFSPEEIEHYRKLYENEKVDAKPLAKIK